MYDEFWELTKDSVPGSNTHRNTGLSSTHWHVYTDPTRTKSHTHTHTHKCTPIKHTLKDKQTHTLYWEQHITHIDMLSFDRPWPQLDYQANHACEQAGASKQNTDTYYNHKGHVRHPSNLTNWTINVWEEKDNWGSFENRGEVLHLKTTAIISLIYYGLNVRSIWRFLLCKTVNRHDFLTCFLSPPLHLFSLHPSQWSAPPFLLSELSRGPTPEVAVETAHW